VPFFFTLAILNFHELNGFILASKSKISYVDSVLSRVCRLFVARWGLIVRIHVVLKFKICLSFVVFVQSRGLH